MSFLKSLSFIVLKIIIKIILAITIPLFILAALISLITGENVFNILKNFIF